MAVTADVVVVGGGVIGTAIAWRAAAAGLGVVLVDPGREDGASLVAAGMLAPVSESSFGEEALLRLNLLAVRRFPTFAAELEERTGQPVGLRQEGTLAVAYDPGDHAALLRLTEFRRSVGLDATELDSRAIRKLEPFLAPGVRGGALFAGDWSVDNRRYLAALRRAAQDAGVRTVPDQVTGIAAADGQAAGVQLADGAAVSCATVVIAAGWASAGIAGLPGRLAEVVRPVKGQLLRLRLPAAMPPVLGRTVRAVVRGTRRLLGAADRRRAGDRGHRGGARPGPDGDRWRRARPAPRRAQRAPGAQRAGAG